MRRYFGGIVDDFWVASLTMYALCVLVTHMVVVPCETSKLQLGAAVTASTACASIQPSYVNNATASQIHTHTLYELNIFGVYSNAC